MSSVVISYYWKEVSNDGLLKDPSNQGPYWESENINGYSSGFETKEDAIEAMLSFHKRYNIMYEEYTLLESYMIKEELSE